MPTVPAIVEIEVNEEYDLSSLKLVISTGSALNPRTAKRLQERYPDIKLICYYGSTESGGIASKSFSLEVANENTAEGTCVGRVAPGVTIKVSPGDVEAILQLHPAVLEATMLGKPAEVEGEELPAAFVVLRPGAVVTEDEIVGFVAKQATWYMQLRGGVRFVPELPRNSRRKILRRQLKEMLAHN